MMHLHEMIPSMKIMAQSFFSFCMISVILHAVEIPVKDLTQEARTSDLEISSSIPRAIPVAPMTSQKSTSATKLELVLKEIQALKKAALAAGGDLEVSIRLTGGIQAEDLVVPLSKMGEFEIKPGRSPGSIRVESRSKIIEGTGSSSREVPTVHLKPKTSSESDSKTQTLVLP